MPKPLPIWERWRKDPKNAEKVYYFYWAAVIGLNGLILLGAIMFVILLLKR